MRIGKQAPAVDFELAIVAGQVYPQKNVGPAETD